MADGLNDARAMRIAEVAGDYSQYQEQIAMYGPYLQQVQQGSAGFAVLHQTLKEAQALLSKPFGGSDMGAPQSPGEGTKKQLQGVLLDAASRRFRAMRLYQRAAAAVRWMQRRNQLLQGRQPTAAMQATLSQVDNALRQEILGVTDQRVFQELNQQDSAAGHWTSEMPSLQAIQRHIQQQG